MTTLLNIVVITLLLFVALNILLDLYPERKEVAQSEVQSEEDAIYIKFRFYMQVSLIRKRDIERCGSYTAWLIHECNREMEYTPYGYGPLQLDRDIKLCLVHNFRDKSVEYMKAYVRSLGLDPNRETPVTFEEIKIALAISRAWPIPPPLIEKDVK